MAFCPHCGKSVTDQASKCLACGNEFEPRAKAARFKGTMMMQPSAGGTPATPAAPVAPKPAPEARKPEPAPAAPAAHAPAPNKFSKATMLGTGGAGLAPPANRASAEATAAAIAKPPAAVGAARAAVPAAAAAATPAAPRVTEPDVTLAQTARLRTEPSLQHAQVTPETESPAAAPREDSQRFLVGDPMAPVPKAGAREERTVRRSMTLDRSDEPRAGVLIAVGIAGVLVIAAIGYITARYLGLL